MEGINLNITPHSMEAGDVLKHLKSDAQKGLSLAEAKQRLVAFGTNKISSEKSRSGWAIFLRQFNNPMVWLLFIASGLSFYFQEWLNGNAILIVILINVIIGFYMEFQAETSMNALKKMSTVPGRVVRNGHMQEINSEEIVPGDIVFFEAGDMIPADGRIIRSFQVQMDESALTGESLPVVKSVDSIPADTTLAERCNMGYKGTFSTKGNGYMVVTSTGMETELGKIAGLVHSAEQASTPLEKKLQEFSKKLILITLGLVVIIFVVGLLEGQKFIEILQTSIALAVAAIPEGLPIVATMALAQGMLKMAGFNVIVKKLSAVETLGGTNVICTDKTGTLTENRIEVNTIVTPAGNPESLALAYRIAVLCNTAELQKINGIVKEIGDPLETGLLKFAEKNSIDIEKCRDDFQKIKEEPFSSETKIMSTLHLNSGEKSIYSKGATEELLENCSHILEAEGIVVLSSENREIWIKKAEDMAFSGLRVIAGAYKSNVTDEHVLSQNLVFVGLYGMIDPPRSEVYEAIRECKTAGIRIVMVTGDHPATAKNIALKLGIFNKKEPKVMLGKEMHDFEKLTGEDKHNWVETSVFARVSPKQKLDLVTVFQENKNIVGMTGDGVNDAPALKKADIGIAMGLRGTQVSQEVADMVLKDDSFSSIVIAIKQGRIIFGNIRKFVIFLLSCNLSELMVIATVSFLNLHFQLFPLQILFINLITDVLPALALGITEGSDSVMRRPPRNMNEPLIDRNKWISIFSYSVIIGACSVGAVFFSHIAVHNREVWNPELSNNILFFTLILSQLLHVLNMGDGTSFFRSEVMKSKYVWGAIIISLIILFGLYAVPMVRTVLSIYSMSVSDWLVISGASVLSLVFIQIAKKIRLVGN